MDRVLEPSSPRPDALPPGWTRRSIAETCHPPEYGHTATAERATVGPRFLRITDIQNHGVDWDHVPFCRCEGPARTRLTLRPGDLLVARIGGTTGKTFLVRECPETVFASYLIRLRPCSVDPEFLYYFTKSSFYWRQVDAHKGEKLKGGISGSVLRNLVHPYPPLPEQRAIAAALRALERRLQAEGDRIASLRTLKAATMTKLFREGVKGRALIDSALGRIPDDWKITTLGSLCSPEGAIQTGPFGSQLHAHDYLPDGVPIINPTHIAEGRVVETEIPRISHSDATRLSRHALRSGDILFSRRGDVGRHALISDREAGWLCGTGCLLVRPAERAVNSAYLSLFLDTPFAQNFLKAKAAGTIMPNINTKILASIPVARPSLAEQQQIADHLDCVMREIGLTKERLDRHEALFATALSRLMTGALRLPPTLSDLEDVDAS